MDQDKIRVLLLDDEESVRLPLQKYLQNSHGYLVDVAAGGGEALGMVETAQGRYDVALLDEVLREDLDGIEVMQAIKTRYPDVECIILTGWGYESALQALRAGAYRYLAKPVNPDELAMLIRTAAEHRRLKRELESTRREKEWLQTFLEIGKAATSVLALDEVLEAVHVQVGRLLDASGLHVVLYDDQTRMLRFELCYDRGQKQPTWERPYSQDRGLTDWVIRQRQPLLLRDYPNDPLPAPANLRQYGDEADQEVTKSWLGVPLVVRDKVIGAILVQSYQPHCFDETDQQVLTTVASQVATGIENARLYTRLGEAREYLQGLITGSLDAVVATDNEGRITVFNRHAEKLFGYMAGAMQGVSVARLYQDAGAGRRCGGLGRCRVSAWPGCIKMRMRRAAFASLSAARRPCRITKSRFKIGTGGPFPCGCRRSRSATPWDTRSDKQALYGT